MTDKDHPQSPETMDREELNRTWNAMDTAELLAQLDRIADEKTADLPQLSEEALQAQQKALLATLHLAAEKKPKPRRRTGKRIAAVLLAAVLLALLLGGYTIATKHEFRLLHARVSYDEKGVLSVEFGREQDDLTMSMEQLETYMKEHGFPDVRLPMCFIGDVWRAKVKAPYDPERIAALGVTITNGTQTYELLVLRSDTSAIMHGHKYPGVQNAESVDANGRTVYVFDYGDAVMLQWFDTMPDGVYEYSIKAHEPYADMLALAKTV